MSVLQPLQETTLELRHGCTEFEQALESLFHDIDQMRLELTDQMQAVERERQQLKLREAELGQRHQNSEGEVQRVKEELEKRDLQLAKALDDLQAAREELAQQRERESADTAAPAAGRDRTAPHAAGVRGRNAARVPGPATRAGCAAGTCEPIRRAVVPDRRLGTGIDGSPPAVGAGAVPQVARPCSRTPPAATNDEADALALTALEQEREALESELELVRSRAAELNETVAQQQREIAAQKSELGTELQQLRKLVEKQADLIADRAVNARENVPPVGPSSTVPTQPNDPVVNSVMAQFAKLQKDVAQRRRRKA